MSSSVLDWEHVTAALIRLILIVRLSWRGADQMLLFFFQWIFFLADRFSSVVFWNVQSVTMSE